MTKKSRYIKTEFPIRKRDRYGVGKNWLPYMKTDMPEQITLKRDEIGNVIYKKGA